MGEAEQRRQVGALSAREGWRLRVSDLGDGMKAAVRLPVTTYQCTSMLSNFSVSTLRKVSKPGACAFNEGDQRFGVDDFDFLESRQHFIKDDLSFSAHSDLLPPDAVGAQTFVELVEECANKSPLQSSEEMSELVQRVECGKNFPLGVL